MARMQNQYAGRRHSQVAATDRQVEFLKTLLTQRHYTDDIPVEDQVNQIVIIHSQGRFGKTAATTMIQRCLAAPKRVTEQKPTPTAEIELRFYTRGDDVYKVVRAVHGSGHLYAKKFDEQAGSSSLLEGPSDRSRLTRSSSRWREPKSWGRSMASA